MRKIISNSLSPNLTFVDGLRALFSFGERDFLDYFGRKYLLANSARTLFGIIADRMNFQKDKYIAIPAFCCAVMATPWLSRGYKIKWIDTDQNGVIDPADFTKKSENVAAVIIPHIFGQIAPVKQVCEIAKQKNIFTIEDCAHYFDTSPLIADVRVYSFGREKVYSCVSGGAMIWNKDLVFSDTKLIPARFTWTFQHILQIFVLGISLPVWHWGGKYFAGIVSKLHLLPRAVTLAEKSGKEDFPISSMPKIMQRLLSHQLENQDKITKIRQKNYNAWAKVLNYESIPVGYPLRYLVRVDNRAEIIKKSAQNGYNLTDWEGSPIAPHANLAHFGYKSGECPYAEKFAQTYLTFPTNVRVSAVDMERYVFDKK